MARGRTPLAFTEDGGLGRDMNPDVVSAITRLRRDNVLGQAQAPLFDRVARRRVVSVRFEIRALLYAGVLLLASGVGLLVKEHRQDIGPWAIAGGIALAAVSCLVWVTRTAASFSWGAVPSPNVAFDYVLLLGLLLFASDLAYVEVEFTLLGPKWPHHLLVVGVVYLLGAYLWDSRTILGLAPDHAGRMAGRLHHPDPGVAPGGQHGQPACQRRRARRALRRGRGALRPARAKGPLRGGLRQCGAPLAPGRARLRRLRQRADVGCLARRARRRGRPGHVALLAARSLPLFRPGHRRRLCRAPAASVRAVSPPRERSPLLSRRGPGAGRARAHPCRSSKDEGAMRPDSVAWERAAEVRAAAQGWRRVGAIDASTEQAIREAYPDPCITPSAVWRVLTACMVAAVVACTFGALSLAFRPDRAGFQVLMFMFAAVSLVATEVLEALPQCARRGAAGATSLLGVVFLLVGFSLFLLETLNMRFDDAIDTALLVSVLAWAVSAWRWGSPPYAAAAPISLFRFLARLLHGRVLWALVGVALAGLAARRLDEASWAPSHRRAAAVLVVAGILAAYAAVNVYSFDEHLLEDLGRFGAARVAPSPSLIVATALATAVVPQIGRAHV